MTERQPEQIEFRDLIARVQAGDETAIQILYNDYYRHVVAVVRRFLLGSIRSKFDSQDFSQVVWAALLLEPNTLNGITEPAQFLALATTIARNKVSDENRRRTQTVKHSVYLETSFADAAEVAPIMGSDPTPSQFAIANETMALCESNLPPEYRPILELKVAGMTTQAIADRLTINERTVRRVLERLERGID